jgi:esterase/lipase superfamily enzyme
MERILYSWHSPSLNKEMPIAIYGHYGFALLLVPTAAADYLEYERFQMMDQLKPFIEAGKLKVYSIDSINNESWLNSSQDTMIYTSGASFGALHSMNLFLKRPDIINGVIAMSGVYDLTEYTKGHYNDDVYFNSPMHYMPNLTDHNILEQIRSSNHLHIFTGSGAYEDPSSSLHEYCTIKVSIMNWMFGEKSGHMTGIHGELCCPII